MKEIEKIGEGENIMKIAVCEDEPLLVSEITELVEFKMKELNVACTVAPFYDGGSLEESGQDFDLIFLDCRLPDGNGLDVAARLRKKGCRASIIFVTAYEEYVYRSFEVGAFRYLLKPIDPEVLRDAVGSFVNSCEDMAVLSVPAKDKTYHIHINKIMYIESDKKHTVVRLLDRTIESTKSISDYQSEINSISFFRTHRRYLVNMKYIAETDRNILTLSNGEKVEVSRRNLSEFKKSYMNYLKYST